LLALFSLVSMVAFCVVGPVVGWRIGPNARRGGGTPERWIALCLLPICAFGYPLLVVAQAFSGTAALVAMSLGIANALALALAFATPERYAAWVRERARRAAV
jgi:hypothetical protein